MLFNNKKKNLLIIYRLYILKTFYILINKYIYTQKMKKKNKKIIEKKISKIKKKCF